VKRIATLVAIAAAVILIACIPSPAPTPRPSPTAHATPTAIVTADPTASPTIDPTPTPTLDPTPVPTVKATPTASPTVRPTPKAAPAPTLPPTTTALRVTPSATVSITDTCAAGWSVTVDYSGFAWGDVFVAGFLLPGMPSSDGFWNQATWVGSGHVLGLSGASPQAFVEVMVDINPLGTIDPLEFRAVPIGNIVGNGVIDDHPTVYEATLDTTTCPATDSTATFSLPATR
jgi:hypothetical protein